MRKTRGQNYAPSKSAPSNAAETFRARNKFRMLNAHSGRLQRALSKPPICAAGRRIKSSCPPSCAHLSHCMYLYPLREPRDSARALIRTARAKYRCSAYTMPCRRARRRSSRLFAPRPPVHPACRTRVHQIEQVRTRARIMHAHIYIYSTRTCACCANCANYTSARTVQFHTLSESQKISQKLKTRADMRPSRVDGAESQSGLSEGINCQGMSNLSETAAQSDFIPKVSVA